MVVTRIPPAGCDSFAARDISRSKTCSHSNITKMFSTALSVIFPAVASFWSGTKIAISNIWEYPLELRTGVLHFILQVGMILEDMYGDIRESQSSIRFSAKKGNVQNSYIITTGIQPGEGVAVHGCSVLSLYI